MLSLERWKARIIWLRDWLKARSHGVAAFMWKRPLVSTLALLVAAAVITEGYRYRVEVQSFLDNGRDGNIIENSPTVYTRHRLVNDRLEQAHWLRTQLEITEDSKDKKEFQTIDAIRRL